MANLLLSPLVSIFGLETKTIMRPRRRLSDRTHFSSTAGAGRPTVVLDDNGSGHSTVDRQAGLFSNTRTSDGGFQGTIGGRLVCFRAQTEFQNLGSSWNDMAGVPLALRAEQLGGIAMPKFFVPIALVIAMFPAVTIAQTTNTNPQGAQSVQPTKPNSGAGIAGQPGNKSGPAAKKPETTGSDDRPPQDSSNIPGKPGSKSGPVQRSPSITVK
jgi:hypothetical protein